MDELIKNDSNVNQTEEVTQNVKRNKEIKQNEEMRSKIGQLSPIISPIQS